MWNAKIRWNKIKRSDLNTQHSERLRVARTEYCHTRWVNCCAGQSHFCPQPSTICANTSIFLRFFLCSVLLNFLFYLLRNSYSVTRSAIRRCDYGAASKEIRIESNLHIHRWYFSCSKSIYKSRIVHETASKALRWQITFRKSTTHLCGSWCSASGKWNVVFMLIAFRTRDCYISVFCSRSCFFSRVYDRYVSCQIENSLFALAGLRYKFHFRQFSPPAHTNPYIWCV